MGRGPRRLDTSGARVPIVGGNKVTGELTNVQTQHVPRLCAHCIADVPDDVFAEGSAMEFFSRIRPGVTMVDGNELCTHHAREAWNMGSKGSEDTQDA